MKERVKKMLLMGVTQRSEMRRHINVFVAENFPSVSKLDTSYYPTDRFELNYVQGHDSTSAHAHGPGESVESRNTHLLLLEFSQFKHTNNFENELYVCILFKVHNWKETRNDFFFFRPATQDHDVIDADNESEMYNQDEIAEDDILYAQPTTYEGDSGNTLLFVHQSTEQLAILKR